MTIVEVVVASFLLAMVVVSTFGVVDTATRSTYRAEETQTVINIAQREIELMRERPYSQLAMTGMPPLPHGADAPANRPTSRIRTGNKFCLDRVDGDDTCPPASLASLVVNGGTLEEGGQVTGGQIAPFSDNVPVGDITVDIYRFIVWQNEGDASLLPPTDPLCQKKPAHYRCKAQDYKRAAVVVQVEKPAISHERPYEEVQSDFIDPDRATLDAPPLGPGGAVVTGEQFWLSDVRCQTGAGDPPRPPATHHQTHNTLGTNCTTNQPNALLSDPPPDPEPGNPNVPAFYDFSTEIEPPCPSPPPSPLPPEWPVDCVTSDHGLQMLDQSGPCVANPTGPDALKQIHVWVSSPMPSNFVLTDKATLNLATKTINGVQASGQVCAFLFKRSTGGADTILKTASHSTPSWPAGPAWADVALQFNLADLLLAQRTLVANERLGVSIGVDPSGTPDNVLQFLYDHPEGRSRLEVLTTTPLP